MTACQIAMWCLIPGTVLAIAVGAYLWLRKPKISKDDLERFSY